MLKGFLLKYFESIQGWFTSRYWPVILACVGIILTLPALGSGLVFDDYWHSTMFAGRWPWSAEDGSLIGMFSFMDGTLEGSQALKEAGIVPWWMFDGIKAAFWRPLTELTHWIDYQLWPDAPWLMHVHSLLWFGAAIWLAAKLYRRIIGTVWVAGLAGLLFAVDNTHALPAGFIANRNDLIAACFGILALLAHIRWRQDGWRPGAVWGPLCYTLGLFSKESALAVGAYLFAYTLFLDHSRIRRRVAGFLPYVVITLVWFCAYRYLGFGTQGFGIDFYIDPGRAPLLFLKEVFVRLPMLLLAQFSGPPAEVWAGTYFFLPYGKVIIGFLAPGLLGLLGFSVIPLFRYDAVIRFWFVGAILGLTPICAAFPSSRLLFFAGIGLMGIIARVLALWLEQPACSPKRHFLKRHFRQQCTHIVCLSLVVIHLILSPLTLFVYTTGLNVAHYLIRYHTSALPYDEDISRKTVVLLNPPTELVGGYASQVKAAHGEPTPAHVWALASCMYAFTLTRIDDRSIEIESGQGLLDTFTGRLLRGPSHPMYVGQRVVLSGMMVEVLALADDWQPARIRVTFSVSLDDPSLLLLYVKNGRLVPYTPPAIGETVSLPSNRSLFEQIVRL
ncbi:hypothetical protein U27_05688 [Candidatus Vecturithrix granuli]|uniref:Glycosyltransferase RgtA/B/C/D-like domain-containing protein n=1 Tax=Vecturithrix granuli TaxID=1499967 RepID=A0A081C2A8_VECG1|nr:hypothetical protein U27_05688 [Candidatus Vecturithrix granuli]